MASNKQIDEILKVNTGVADRAPSWQDGGEMYQAEVNNPQELYWARQNHITYGITPTSGVVNSGTDLQLIVEAVRGDGARLESNVNPESFEWVSSTSDVTVDANGLVKYVEGTGTAYVGAICRPLNEGQNHADAVLCEITYSA